MKLAVDFTSAAINDLSDIASYTADTWGREQAFSYAGLLHGRFIEIAEGRIFSKVPFSKYPNVRVCRCEHHYIFFIRPQESPKPVILAVLHERMNLLERLKDRLRGVN
ncbi:MAG: type II toxin-antitoxin system RelE/ParE family toxin [Methylicorpusculum sp.]|uniref:type II toxin-antitoxin system RelE/ParE family toxin n=1 Tax=Methylicorpusculum sp. TaxID=2713644 RepID=UPI0027307173|nr:type II toxin-antitoxin system RelE/ParE family toxin [Methylicorpusculum sp.]MDP2177642.1 type II toxin-antitoxin system RelE/ParE family toxin [Methylicorpusculum sp.]